MSTDTGDTPDSTAIHLTYEDERWVATDEGTNVSARGKTRTEALAALDAKLAGDSNTVPTEDPLFTAPSFSSGLDDTSVDVDAALDRTADVDR
ncbi:hypothetical protein Halru_3027 [Halovivax ruber XH-70]|uniref:Uncharacterized protein n=1 Tax=Halovivax ruber (strain DSM 18193 / JCM 13892 / XH-70) TaxID=797302 RepID=L0IFH2_HALRX|nr:hypothetical protein [Halovivax ruber]AGB17593.1 hypothetical protein Halru_3027 [Halovivax ruber XH-70]